MAAYNTGAVLQGLNDGVINMWKFGLQQSRLDRQEDRQAAADQRASELHELNRRARTMEIEEADRAIRERAGARQAATPQKAQDGFAVGAQGSQNFYGDQAAAQAQAENEAFIAGADATQAPRQATAITGGGTPKIAGYGTKADNSREGTAKRVADYWRSLGETDKADQIEMQAKETSKKFYDAAREELFRGALIAGNDGPQAFVDALYKGYGDGFEARVVASPGGGGRVEKVGKDGKVVGSMDFSSMDDLASKAYQLVFPDRVHESRMKTQAELAKENVKPINTPAGGITTLRNPDGSVRQTIRNDTGYEPTGEIGSDGQPILRRISSSGSSSSGGKGAKVDDPVKAAAEAVLEQATKGEIKLQPSQLSDAQLRAAQIATRGVPMYVAANVAIKVAQDPTAIKPRIDTKTGLIENVYEDSAVGQVVVDRDIATARNPRGMTKEQLQGFAKQVVGSVGNPEGQKSLVAAAFDPKARRMVEDQLTSEIDKQFQQALQSNPGARAQIEAQRNATVKSSLEALGRKLDLINGHYPKPAEEKPAAKRVEPSAVGGLGINRFAGKSPREIDQMVAQEARDFRSQNKRTTLDSTAAARDPDIIRLNAEKEAALRAGKPVVANAKIEEIKKIQAERYMVQR